MRQQTAHCDLCKEEMVGDETELQVIFETEQNEGRSSEPYLSIEIIDICPKCMKHLLAGNYVFAVGAMGFNKYYFKK